MDYEILCGVFLCSWVQLSHLGLEDFSSSRLRGCTNARSPTYLFGSLAISSGYSREMRQLESGKVLRQLAGSMAVCECLIDLWMSYN